MTRLVGNKQHQQSQGGDVAVGQQVDWFGLFGGCILGT